MTRYGEAPGASEGDFSRTLPQDAPSSSSRRKPLGEGPAGERTRFGDYEIIRKIAKGGMGFVYEARHVKLGLPVALKMIGAGDAATLDDVQRFLVEAQAVAKLHKHPNIVKIYSISEEGGQYFFAMQLIRGGSLKERLLECSNDLRGAVELMAKVTEAIAHAHRRGVLHRDIKPDNILIDEEGTPYVTDFGLAKRVDPTEGAGMTLGPDAMSQVLWAGPEGPDPPRPEPSRGSNRGFESSKDVEGSIVGTPSYMPPEQAQGRHKDVSTLSDVYSLGATFFTMICNRTPFTGPGVQNTLNQVIKEKPPAPSSINPRVDPDLDAICLKCLEKDPKDRYESADAFGRDLRRWLEGKPVHARPISNVEKVRKWVRREPLKAVAAGLGVTMFSVLPLLSVLIVLSNRDRNDARASSADTMQLAGKVIQDIVDDVESKLGADAEQKDLRMTLLGRSLDYFRGITEKKSQADFRDRKSRLELARAHQQVAEILGKLEADRDEEMKSNYEASVEILGELVDSTDEDDQRGRDGLLSQLGNAYLEYGIALLGLGMADDAMRQYEKGRETYLRACPICRRTGHGQRPDGCEGDREIRTGLGRVLGYIGDVEEAVGHVAQAQRAYEWSHQIRDKLYSDSRDDLKIGPKEKFESAFQLARSHANLANLARHRGNLTRAINKEREATRLQEELMSKPFLDDYDRRLTLSDHAFYLRQSARFRIEDGQFQEALAEVSKAAEEDERLIRDKKGVASYRVEGAATLLVKAQAYLALQEVPRAKEACQEAANLLDSAKEFEGLSSSKLASAHRYTLVGQIALLEGHPAEARAPLDQASTLLEALIKQEPQNQEYLSDRAEVFFLLAQAHPASSPLAKQFYNRALNEQSKVVETSKAAKAEGDGEVDLFRDRLERIKAARHNFD